jgi:hypothetical protein
LEKYSTNNLKKHDMIDAVQRYDQFLSDVAGEHLDDISTSVEKQKKVNELFNNDQYRIEDTLWMFRLIVMELDDYRKIEKSSCLLKILTKNLNSSNSLWSKIFKITNAEYSSNDFGKLLNIRIVRQTVFNIVETYFKSLLAYDGHYLISDKSLKALEDKSKVELLKSIDISNMLGFLYFLVNYKDEISDKMSKLMAELDPDFTRYIAKSFRNLSL